MVQDELMRIAVTGGSGKLGRTVVRQLREHGHLVINVDQWGERSPGFVRIDLRDAGHVLDALTGIDEQAPEGFDAVVHLSAIPAPGLATNTATFQNNLISTYNVFNAAIKAGITNIVTASSETVLGLPFDTPPPYIPADEDYAARPESTYSLSKHLEEQLAIELTRWHPELKIIALRFSNVMDEEDYGAFPSFDADATLRKWNLWSYIDGRDGAEAVRLALEHPATGFDRFIIAAADTVMSRDNTELVAEVFPDVPVNGDISGNGTLLSIDKARTVLGFDPQHSWR